MVAIRPRFTRLFNPTTTPATSTSGSGTPTSAAAPSGLQPPWALMTEEVNRRRSVANSVGPPSRRAGPTPPTRRPTATNTKPTYASDGGRALCGGAEAGSPIAASVGGYSQVSGRFVTEKLGRAPALTYRIVGCSDFSLLANSSQAFAYE
jgi:hypothetical protein